MSDNFQHTRIVLLALLQGLQCFPQSDIFAGELIVQASKYTDMFFLNCTSYATKGTG